MLRENFLIQCLFCRKGWFVIDIVLTICNSSIHTGELIEEGMVGCYCCAMRGTSEWILLTLFLMIAKRCLAQGNLSTQWPKHVHKNAQILSDWIRNNNNAISYANPCCCVNYNTVIHNFHLWLDWCNSQCQRFAYVQMCVKIHIVAF